MGKVGPTVVTLVDNPVLSIIAGTGSMGPVTGGSWPGYR